MTWDDGAVEDAWGMFAGSKSEGYECGSSLLVPVSWRALESVEGLLEEEISFGFVERASSGWFYYVLFVGGEDRLDECL